MFWLTQIDTRSEAGTAPGTDTAFVDATRRAFVRSYRHLFSERGLPIFGRSICYRTAASAPLLISARQGDGVITPGEARRAFDRSWRYFVNRGALAGGTLTQGYCAADARILDRYSGPASCLWGTRSLVIALLDRAGAPFWSDPERPLAVELGDFDLSVRAAGLRITGDRARGAVEVEPLAATSGAVPLQPYTWRHRLAEAVLRRPFRPENEAAKYQGAVYASAEPFCGCPTPGLE